MQSFLLFLNSYASLILVAVTVVYVILTWRLVLETRRAREAESEPQLIATLIPIAAMLVKLRISNVGRGPALDIQANIFLEPNKGDDISTWRHPALLSNAYEDFRLEGDNNYLDKLAANYDRLIVDLEWHDSLKRKETKKYEIDLKRLLEGWTKAKFLVHPDDLPIQLAKIRDELKAMNARQERQENRQIAMDLEKRALREKSKQAIKKKKQ